MRLTHFCTSSMRLVGAIGSVALGALCCTNVPLLTAGLSETTNSSLWACVTTAALALVCVKRSQ